MGMNFHALRAACVALHLGICAQTAAAHPLPETRITISTGGGDLVLTVAVPVPELNLAMQDGLGDAPPSGPVPPAQLAKLSAYFGAHLGVSMADVGALNMRLRGASIIDAASTETGHFDLVTMDFAAPLPMDIGIFPMTLRYDAVMHQVRNHRADVFWARQDQPTLQLGQIKFDQKLGKTVPLILDPAP